MTGQTHRGAPTGGDAEATDLRVQHVVARAAGLGLAVGQQGRRYWLDVDATVGPRIALVPSRWPMTLDKLEDYLTKLERENVYDC